MSKNAKEGVRLTRFGEILMQLRQEKHLSQAELGRIIYVSGGTISNYSASYIARSVGGGT